MRKGINKKILFFPLLFFFLTALFLGVLIQCRFFFLLAFPFFTLSVIDLWDFHDRKLNLWPVIARSWLTVISIPFSSLPVIALHSPLL